MNSKSELDVIEARPTSSVVLFHTRRTMRWLLLAPAVLLVALQTADGVRLCDKKCYLGQECWPSDKDVADFAYSLEGEFVYPSHPLYASSIKMKNDRVKKAPAVIVYVQSVHDVKTCVNFARKYNMRVSIMSTGHSYIGRSTHDGSLLIHMGNMTDMEVRTDLIGRSPGGEITVQTGNTWARVYKEVDKYDRLIVGGSAHTVGMGGYTQGGGHSPMSRSLGLAVDNLLEAKLVTAEGHLVTASAAGVHNEDTGETNMNPELFWALRGGGGGTWGVVISFTFKLHIAPPQFLHFVSFYPMVVNDTTPGVQVLQSIIPKLATLSRQWGGYVVLNTEPNPDPALVGVHGSIVLSLNHFGPLTSESWSAIQPLLNDPLSVYTDLNNKTSFWDYEKDVHDTDVSSLRTYIVNGLIPADVDVQEFSSMIVEELFAGLTDTSGSGGTFTLLGGQMRDVPYSATPIHPGFRDSLFSVSCGRIWYDPTQDPHHIGHTRRFNSRLGQFRKGVYYNEPAEDLDTWKTSFWGEGGNYERLLRVKTEWDPHNFFCCHNCVGFDRDDGEKCPWGQFPTSGSGKILPVTILTIVLSCISF